jgi:hypothetical protein
MCNPYHVAGYCPEDIDVMPVPVWGRIIIEWPAPDRGEPLAGGRLMPGWQCKILDAETGSIISTVMSATLPLGCVTAEAGQFITADLAMLADDHGKPLMGGKTVYPDGNGGIRQGTFRFLVAEMRVAQPGKVAG